MSSRADSVRRAPRLRLRRTHRALLVCRRALHRLATDVRSKRRIVSINSNMRRFKLVMPIQPDGIFVKDTRAIASFSLTQQWPGRCENMSLVDTLSRQVERDHGRSRREFRTRPEGEQFFLFLRRAVLVGRAAELSGKRSVDCVGDLVSSPASANLVMDLATSRPTIPSGVPSILASISHGSSTRVSSTVTANLNFMYATLVSNFAS
jgi:hypothetical protein